ncbi:MAG: hypothetical protein QY318_01475 [Candidatus Dojkabacteria bacterium]|nr:MAG: hypothetical protein QY318_01475 [Candidatus Dojkabacteria bacterium]
MAKEMKITTAKKSGSTVNQKLQLAKSRRLMRANTYLVFMLIAVIAVLSSVVVWQLWVR